MTWITGNTQAKLLGTAIEPKKGRTPSQRRIRWKALVLPVMMLIASMTCFSPVLAQTTDGLIIENIKSWSAISDSVVIVDTYDTRTYWLHVPEPCDGLRTADMLGFATESGSKFASPTRLILQDGTDCGVSDILLVSWKPNRQLQALSSLGSSNEHRVR